MKRKKLKTQVNKPSQKLVRKTLNQFNQVDTLMLERQMNEHTSPNGRVKGGEIHFDKLPGVGK